MGETAKNPMGLTKIYLYIWNFCEKPIFVHLPYWFCGNFRENSKTRPRILFSPSDPIFALRRHLENPKTGYTQKKSDRAAFGVKLGGRSVGWVNWLPDHVMGPQKDMLGASA